MNHKEFLSFSKKALGITMHSQDGLGGFLKILDFLDLCYVSYYDFIRILLGN